MAGAASYSACQTKQEVLLQLDNDRLGLDQQFGVWEGNAGSSTDVSALRNAILNFEKDVVRAANRLVSLGVTV